MSQYLAILALLLPAVCFANDASFPGETVYTNSVNTTTCTWFTDGKPYGYCATVTPGSQSKDILYYFHGAMGDQKGWLGKASRIWKAWDGHGIDAPVVITISFGRIWMMAEKNSSPLSGAFETITKKMMPEIEARWWKHAGEGRRLLAGESMGAFNAFQLLSHFPNRWSRVALMCADVADIGPFSSIDDMDDYVKETGADKFLTFWEKIMDRMFYGDEDAWDRAAPIKMAPKIFGPDTPPLYISGSHLDQFGFFSGDQWLAKLAAERGISVLWDELPGKHCAYTPDTVAQFIVAPTGAPSEN